jgi:hypothetical protein
MCTGRVSLMNFSRTAYQKGNVVHPVTNQQVRSNFGGQKMGTRFR